MAKHCPSDQSVSWLTGDCGVDFTIAFEDYILILIPAACLLLLAPLRLRTIWSRSVKVITPTILQLFKTLSSSLFVGFSFAVLIANCARSETARSAEIPASVIAFLASLAAFALSHWEHVRSIRPSKLLQLYLLVALIMQVVHLRTIWIRQDDIVLQGLGIGQVVSCAMFLAAESGGKQHILLTKQRRSPQDVNDLFSERLFWWLNHLFKRGYRSMLAPSDLDQTDEDLSSPEIDRTFRLTWLKHYHRDPKVSMVRIVFSAMRYDILFPIIPRLLLLAVNFAQPFLIMKLVDYLQNQSEGGSEQGIFLVLATAVEYTALATFQGWYWQSQARFLVKLRGCLTTALHDKALRCRSDSKSSPLTLMNVDVERVLVGLKQMHEFWATTLAIGIALFLLYDQVGAVFIAPLILLVAMLAITTVNGTRVAPKQKLWFTATQERISYITSVISSMKNVKLLGIVPHVFRQGTELRNHEVDAQSAVRGTILLNIALSNSTYQLATLVLFGAYAVRTHYGGEPLNNTKLFTSLSILKLFTSPMLRTMQAIPGTIQSVASLQRIQDYLVTDDFEDKRHIKNEGDYPIPSATKSGFRTSDEIPIAQLEDVTCGYSQDAIILSDISSQLDNGTLNIVVGPVGSGKSTLLKTFLGESVILTGRVSVATRDAALCDQTSWLWHASVKENICGIYPFEKAWFNEVAWACGLQEDFNQLPQGVHTLVGSDGTALSGGQKNRVSLARALYSRKRFVVLDDVLSGLDTRTEKLVFTRVFASGGLFKRMKCTVLFATHAIGWACFADKLIAVDQGKIVFQGSPLNAPASYSTLKESVGRPVTPPEKFPNVHETWEVDDFPEPSSSNPVEGSRSSDRQVYKQYFASFGYPMLLIYFMFSSAFIGSSTLQSLWLKWWAAAEPSNSQELGKYAGTFAGISALYIVITFSFLAYGFLIMLPKSSRYLHAKQWVALVKVAFSSWGSKDTGSVTNRFSQDISIMDTQLSMNFINVTTIAFSCIASTGILIVATPFIAAALPALMLVLWAIQKIYLRTSKQLRVMDLEAKAPLCTHFLETVSGIATITAYGWSDSYRDKNAELLGDSQVPFYLFESVQNWLLFVLNLVVAGLATVIMAIAVKLRSDVDAGYIGLALVEIMDLGEYAEVLILSWTGLENSLGAIARMNEFIEDMPMEEQGRVVPPLDWLSEGKVEINNLLASYSDTADPTLKDISLTITPGEKIAICGRTGSGKSSLASAIFGLLHVRNGTIKIDGVDITAISQDLLRSKMVAIPQDPYFTPGTVRDNLALTSPSASGLSDTTMLDALRKVGLSDKFDTLAATSDEMWLGALDVKLAPADMLTKGQMQLFAMARAILSPGQIVLIDEATSGLDHVSEALVQKLLRKELSGRTIVAIAHHLSTITDFDTVIVMDNGRIAEIGHPGQLADTKGSLFQGLLHAAN